MSRYTIPAFDPAHRLIVGWDAPLQTYFVQVFVPTQNNDDGEECIELWEGTDVESLPWLTHLVRVMRHYGTLPVEIAQQLVTDKLRSTKPTPLQQRMQHMLRQARSGLP